MEEFTRQEILNHVGPCSLLCYTCPGYSEGAVGKCAASLCNYLEGYYDFNDINLPQEYRYWLKEFESFYNNLQGYTKGNCPGCRNLTAASPGCVKGCLILSCTKDHGVDFCGDCSEFPCSKVNTFFNEKLRAAWLKGNTRIKEVGFEQYFTENKNTSHYIDYKKAKE